MTALERPGLMPKKSARRGYDELHRRIGETAVTHSAFGTSRMKAAANLTAQGLVDRRMTLAT